MQPNEIVANRYKIVKLLDHGTYEQEFKTQDLMQRKEVALKMNKAYGSTNEVSILKVMRDPYSQSVTQMRDSGTHKGRRFMVFDLMGSNLGTEIQ